MAASTVPASVGPRLTWFAWRGDRLVGTPPCFFPLTYACNILQPTNNCDWDIYIYIYIQNKYGLIWRFQDLDEPITNIMSCFVVDSCAQLLMGILPPSFPIIFWPTLALQRQMWQWCLLFNIPSLASPCFAGQNEVPKFGGFPSLPWWIRCRLPLRSQLGHHLGFRIRIPQRIINQPG